MSAGPVLIMAGGTGGHVFPALSVADALRARGVPVVWLGTPGGMESRLVPANGFPIEWVRVAGVRGKGLMTWLRAPFKLVQAVREARGVLAEELRERHGGNRDVGGPAALDHARESGRRGRDGQLD